jgi:hypothetical protein
LVLVNLPKTHNITLRGSVKATDSAGGQQPLSLVFPRQQGGIGAGANQEWPFRAALSFERMQGQLTPVVALILPPENVCATPSIIIIIIIIVIATLLSPSRLAAHSIRSNVHVVLLHSS